MLQTASRLASVLEWESSDELESANLSAISDEELDLDATDSADSMFEMEELEFPDKEFEDLESRLPPEEELPIEEGQNSSAETAGSGRVGRWIP